MNIDPNNIAGMVQSLFRILPGFSRLHHLAVADSEPGRAPLPRLMLPTRS